MGEENESLEKTAETLNDVKKTLFPISDTVDRMFRLQYVATMGELLMMSVILVVVLFSGV